MAKYLALVGLAATYAGVALAAPTPAVVTGTMASFDAVVAEPVRARRAATTTGPCKNGQQISYFDCFCAVGSTNFNQVCASKKLKTAADCKSERKNAITNGDLPGFFKRCAYYDTRFLQRCSKECCKEPSAEELAQDNTGQMGMCQFDFDPSAKCGVRFTPGPNTCGSATGTSTTETVSSTTTTETSTTATGTSGRRQRSIEFAAGGPDGAGDLADDEVDEEGREDPGGCMCVLDSETWKSQKGNKSCKWISKEPKQRCQKTGKKYTSDGGETAAQACRAACDMWAK